MNPIVKKDILNVLNQAIEIISKGDYFKLREISDHVIHNASIFQDKESITVAIMIYSLSKIYRVVNLSIFLEKIKNAIIFLERGDTNNYDREIKEIMKEISNNDEKTRFYIQEVFELAQIKKASRIYEHGISMGQVADALGISIWDLMEYIGKTRIVDELDYSNNIHSKIEIARKIFQKG